MIDEVDKIRLYTYFIQFLNGLNAEKIGFNNELAAISPNRTVPKKNHSEQVTNDDKNMLYLRRGFILVYV